MAIKAGVTLVLGIASLGAGLWLSTTNGDWTWFSRSGAVMVVLGAYYTTFTAMTTGEIMRHWLHQIVRFERPPREKLGFVMIVLGTLIWAFGDLPGAIL